MAAIARGGGDLPAGAAVDHRRGKLHVQLHPWPAPARSAAGGDLTVQANTVTNKALQTITTTGDDGNVGSGEWPSPTTNDTTTARFERARPQFRRRHARPG